MKKSLLNITFLLICFDAHPEPELHKFLMEKQNEGRKGKIVFLVNSEDQNLVYSAATFQRLRGIEPERYNDYAMLQLLSHDYGSHKKTEETKDVLTSNLIDFIENYTKGALAHLPKKPYKGFIINLGKLCNDEVVKLRKLKNAFEKNNYTIEKISLFTDSAITLAVKTYDNENTSVLKDVIIHPEK